MIDRWLQTWKSLALTYPDQIHPSLIHHPRCRETDKLFDLLADAYAKKPREHHTMKLHLRECFEFYDSLPFTLPGKSAATEMALWFHDVVQPWESVPAEEASAKLCKRLLMEVGVFEGLATNISSLILADHNSALTNVEQQVMCDVDLWILAAPPERFKQYDEVQIRNEYGAVPDNVYYPTRRQIMKHFYEKEHIYYSPEIRGLLESRAKANLAKYAK